MQPTRREPALISQIEMMRQLHAFALEETRNRALEEAAQVIDRFERERRPLYWSAGEIRRKKRDPSAQMTDWWAKPIAPIDFIPMGA